MEKADQIKQYARDIGFSDVRIGEPMDFSERLQEWLDMGYHGQMDWMARDPAVRGNPKNLWPDVKSVIAVGLNYGPDHNPLEPNIGPRTCSGGPEPEWAPGMRRGPKYDHIGDPDTGYISVYARGDDYHDVVKKKIKQLGGWVGRTFDCELKVFVDTAPVMEKPLAHAAGLGWQGKHTNLVSRAFGSYLFLGIIYTNLELPFDAPETDHCGNCRKCLDICPTNAFPSPYKLDARKCISYLTIEHNGPIPVEYREAMGNRIYGCDDCLAVCPWNKFASQTAEMAFMPRAALTGPKLAELAVLDDASFHELFRKSPIKRIGRNKFVRNVLIAIGNSGNQSLIPTAQALENDPDFAVVDAAKWAVQKLRAHCHPGPRASPSANQRINSGRDLDDIKTRSRPTPG